MNASMRALKIKKGWTKNMPNQQSHQLPTWHPDMVEETIRLYHAWLAVLLAKLDAKEVRVGVNEIKEALGQFKCTIGKDGDSYIIYMGDDEDESEDTHVPQA